MSKSNTKKTPRAWVKGDKGATITCTPPKGVELDNTVEGLFATCTGCEPPVRQLVTTQAVPTRCKVRCACGLDVVVEVA